MQLGTDFANVATTDVRIYKKITPTNDILMLKMNQIEKEKKNFRETLLTEERMERVNDIRHTCENDN